MEGKTSIKRSCHEPVDHPHGGGEGKLQVEESVSPWGQSAKVKTRKPQRSDKLIITRRKKRNNL